jgi:Tfp pilus assembly protein PilF
MPPPVRSKTGLDHSATAAVVRPTAAVSLLLALFMAVSVQGQESAAGENINRGVQAFKAERYADAVAYFQKAVNLDPEFVTARLYLATAYMSQIIPGADSPENQQIAESALAQFREVLNRDASNMLATQSIASIFFKLKDWEKSEEWNRKVLALDSGNKEAFYTLGVIAWTRFLPVDRQARMQIHMKPEDPGPLQDAAVRAQLTGIWMPILDEGIRDENEALKADPDYQDAMAYMNLLIRYRADLLDSADEYQKAIYEADEWVQKTLATQRKNAEKKAAAGAAPPQ